MYVYGFVNVCNVIHLHNSFYKYLFHKYSHLILTDTIIIILTYHHQRRKGRNCPKRIKQQSVTNQRSVFQVAEV